MTQASDFAAIIVRMQAGLDLAAQRFETVPDWRRHLPNTRREIAQCLADASQLIGDAQRSGDIARAKLAEVRARFSQFRATYGVHQMNFLASADISPDEYRSSLTILFRDFDALSACVRRLGWTAEAGG
jgi:hypothetical protein